MPWWWIALLVAPLVLVLAAVVVMLALNGWPTYAAAPRDPKNHDPTS